MYNEPKINYYIEKVLNNNSYKDYEIIVVDGNESSTIDLIKDDSIIKTTSKKGRANQMNKGASLASNSILLFLHADTILPNNAFTSIKDALEDEKIVAGAFDLSFNSNKLMLKIIAKVASLRSRLTKLPYGDQAIFIKKESFFKVNGYEDIKLMEDVNLMQKLKKQNLPIKIVDDTVITSARKWEERGVIYTTLRNWILISLYFFGVNPNKLASFYK